MAKKLRCFLGLHRYQRRVTDDGQPYKECRDCGKFLPKETWRKERPFSPEHRRRAFNSD
jgi:hypothetical protein